MMKKYFQHFCLTVLAVGLFVILWGAWVRFSHSGDGCGTHWPLCQNELIPQTSSQKTWIEWLHRLSSSFFGFLVLALVFMGFKFFPQKHGVRLWSSLLLLFTVIEALIGAVLVTQGLTGQNSSLLRMLILNLHLLNSLSLVACLVFCYRYSIHSQKINFKKILYFAVPFILIALTGSISSLANTLFPSSSLIQGWMMDWSLSSPLLVRLRVLHPLIVLTSFLIGGWILYQKKLFQVSYLFIFLILGFVSGGITLFTLSPLLMKLLHLFLAYVIWILILLKSPESQINS